MGCHPLSVQRPREKGTFQAAGKDKQSQNRVSWIENLAQHPPHNQPEPSGLGDTVLWKPEGAVLLVSWEGMPSLCISMLSPGGGLHRLRLPDLTGKHSSQAFKTGSLCP